MLQPRIAPVTGVLVERVWHDCLGATMTFGYDLTEPSLVRPVISRNTPRLGQFAVIAGVEPDVRMIGEKAAAAGIKDRPIYLSRIYTGMGPANSTLAGPVLGSPQAVMLLENLLAWGARSVMFMGWCGAISSAVAIGDVLNVSGAFCDEGTSMHYGASPGQPVSVAGLSLMPKWIRDGLDRAGVPVHEGMVWTTDAIFRETPSQVSCFQNRGALAVDMETSALLSAAAHLGADICCLLVASDALHGTGWQKGFKDPIFQSHRRLLCKLIADYLSPTDDNL